VLVLPLELEPLEPSRGQVCVSPAWPEFEPEPPRPFAVELAGGDAD